MQGLIFIPDITGFTDFVKTIDIDLGVTITRDLLKGIIENNPLDIHLSEIEGDGVLFYRLGEPIDLKKLLSGFKSMSDAFAQKYAWWKAKYNLEVNLSLKLIVHYGDIKIYNIKGFRKIYGETVIESHRLLKNGSTSTNYVLFTDDYIKALNHNNHDSSHANRHLSYRSYLCAGSKKISYSYFSNTPSGGVSSEKNCKESFIHGSYLHSSSVVI